jgi:hypothetical protein
MSKLVLIEHVMPFWVLLSCNPFSIVMSNQFQLVRMTLELLEVLLLLLLLLQQYEPIHRSGQVVVVDLSTILVNLLMIFGFSDHVEATLLEFLESFRLL